MTDETDPRKALSEIRGLLRHGQAEDARLNGRLMLLWGVLTLAAFVVQLTAGKLGLLRGLLPNLSIWIAHNAVGWTATLVWIARHRRRSGRESYRGHLVSRVWAMVTLCIWLVTWMAWGPGWLGGFAALPLSCLVTGFGILASGLLLQDAAAQGIGVGLALAGAALPAVFGVSDTTVVLECALIPLALLGWGAHAWMVGRRR